ncbi:HEPN domain-containing protein [Staphylothermus hellenicus]|uniref:HEPN domain protein n=1 Tax=Staphylothermus hellenicus (strain DSM 12710 / JCM 10830 / BK20S6-10-b1 / P8) TaxID=591019 RepID=D7D852_STAHD|nr:HEPN domain-containing protein [Staphylothermus hellenicus]ADI31948.1 HEPN domain protein [Staphylothermus hellenicus DSM 12710]
MLREEVYWWLELAKRDLERAKRAIEYDDRVSMVFWSQQAVEKALKALALAVKRDIPKTHNIRRLKEFIGLDLGLSSELWEKAYELTQYYYISLYPDIVEGVPDQVISSKTGREAVEIAEKIVEAVMNEVKRIVKGKS